MKPTIAFPLFWIVATLFATSTYGQVPASDSDDSNPETLTLWATWYYVPVLQHDEAGVELLDADEQSTGLSLNACDWCNAAIQGTVCIKKEGENYILNYAGRSEERQYDCRECAKYASYSGYEKTGKVLWSRSSGFGKGVQNYNLVPFRTIAVDPTVIPYGTVLFISDAVGTVYTNPTGEEVSHDGYFFAGDTGSKITGNHIDVFVGDSRGDLLEFVQSRPEATFQAEVVTDVEVIQELRGLHLSP